MTGIFTFPTFWNSWAITSHWDAFNKKPDRKRWKRKQALAATHADLLTMGLFDKGKRPVAAGKMTSRLERARRRQKMLTIRRTTTWRLTMLAAKGRRVAIRQSRGLVRNLTPKSRKGNRRIATVPPKQLCLRTLRKAKTRKSDRKRWEVETFFGKGGRKSTLKKPKPIPRVRKTVQFMEMVGIKEFSSEQKPSTTLDVFSGSETLKQQPLAFYDGRFDAWTAHASSGFGRQDERVKRQEAGKPFGGKQGPLFRSRQEEDEEEALDARPGDVGEMLRALVLAGQVGGEIRRERDNATGVEWETVVLDSEHDFEAVLRYCEQLSRESGW